MELHGFLASSVLLVSFGVALTSSDYHRAAAEKSKIGLQFTERGDELNDDPDLTLAVTAVPNIWKPFERVLSNYLEMVKHVAHKIRRRPLPASGIQDIPRMKTRSRISMPTIYFKRKIRIRVNKEMKKQHRENMAHDQLVKSYAREQANSAKKTEQLELEKEADTIRAEDAHIETSSDAELESEKEQANHAVRDSNDPNQKTNHRRRDWNQPYQMSHLEAMRGGNPVAIDGETEEEMLVNRNKFLRHNRNLAVEREREEFTEFLSKSELPFDAMKSILRHDLIVARLMQLGTNKFKQDFAMVKAMKKEMRDIQDIRYLHPEENRRIKMFYAWKDMQYLQDLDGLLQKKAIAVEQGNEEAAEKYEQKVLKAVRVEGTKQARRVGSHRRNLERVVKRTKELHEDRIEWLLENGLIKGEKERLLLKRENAMTNSLLRLRRMNTDFRNRNTRFRHRLDRVIGEITTARARLKKALYPEGEERDREIEKEIEHDAEYRRETAKGRFSQDHADFEAHNAKLNIKGKQTVQRSVENSAAPPPKVQLSKDAVADQTGTTDTNSEPSQTLA